MWYKSNPFDIGNTTKTALRVIDLQNADPTISFVNNIQNTITSKSNDCLMRISPLALYCSKMNKDEMYMAIKL
jgi:ADP-ribosylglycohydrolase